MVVEHVGAHFGRVRPILRHDHVRRIQARRRTRSLVVGAMRIKPAEPEAERFPGRDGFEERVEVLEVLSSGRTGSSAGRDVAGSPALARGAADVARARQHFHVGRDVLGQRAPKVRVLAQGVDRASREDGRAGRRAAGRRGERMGEQDSLPGHAVEHRGPHHLVAVGSRVRITPVIGDAEEDVRTFGFVRGGHRPHGQQEGECGEQAG